MSRHQTTVARIRLYHLRERPGGSPLGASDEEECFSSLGRKVGVWLTTEPLHGDVVFEAEVDVDDVVAFEVAPENPPHRAFVVPAVVATQLGLRVG